MQRQRKLETTMRAQRQQIKLLEEGGADEDDIINARCRYRGTSQEYTAFSKAMDLPQQRARVTVDGLGNIGVGKTKKGLTNEDKQDILRAKIENGEISLELNPEKQNPHIKGSAEYNEADGKSYFNITFEQLQEEINLRHATGTVIIKPNGQIKEIIESPMNIGFSVDKDKTHSEETHYFTVHYSEKRTHAVPCRKKSKGG